MSEHCAYIEVTGAEGLYADMGHFGRRAITRAWLFLVFPACILSYLGQGALILDDPDNISSPFFLLVPDWGRWPMVLLATAATVIASQAVITGAYSVASQAAQLGYLPRLRIAHTSESTIGQIYVPWINWLLMVSVLTLVFAFRSSTALAFAFGMAVTGTITTLLFFYVARLRWGTPVWLIATGAAVLLFVDLLFVAANLTKIVHGAWLPLLIGLTAFTVMTTWQRGRQLVTAERAEHEGSLREFVDQLRSGDMPVLQVPGTAVFLNRGKQTAPLAMRANAGHNHVRREQVVILSIETEPVPRVPADQRLVLDDLGYADDGIIHVTARFGYMETPDVPDTLAMLDPAETEGPLHLDQASYFLSKIELRRGEAASMTPWRKRLFIATSHITADAAEHFSLPRTVRSSWARTSRCRRKARLRLRERHAVLPAGRVLRLAGGCDSTQGWRGEIESSRSHPSSLVGVLSAGPSSSNSRPERPQFIRHDPRSRLTLSHDQTNDHPNRKSHDQQLLLGPLSQVIATALYRLPEYSERASWTG
ncbi:KUP/HAK/KT family potassium transporter [Streptomyces sp. NPDC060011]|uniref:KUP/HAK/KT family potassium transporter n=1 Tax=Streptomyces sp. NPDC060011 TaxID=3347037 RepID=UPI0036A694EB